MKEVIERMRRAEEEAARLLQQAEEEAHRILENARQQARQDAEEKRKAAHEQAEALIGAAREAARKRREELLAQNEADMKKMADIDPEARDKAIALIFRSVASPSVSSAEAASDTQSRGT